MCKRSMIAVFDVFFNTFYAASSCNAKFALSAAAYRSVAVRPELNTGQSPAVTAVHAEGNIA